MPELRVLSNGNPVGTVVQRPTGRLDFTYERAWQDRGESFPISLSMPLVEREHPDGVVRPYLEGLLPDNASILERWARQFHVSARNPFALLSHMGEDCAGAVQFVRPERYEHVTAAGPQEIDWLSEADLAERLRDLVERHGTGRLPGDGGHFSLAGAQPKMPLFFDGRRWGVPSGRTPTTHILKPPTQTDFDGFDVNEHLCLRLAKELGLAAVDSSVVRFGDQQTLVIARYDRVEAAGNGVLRLHQEDTCQALGTSPHRKYENEGGPGAADIVRLLLLHSDNPEADVATFIDALALNWIIAGTDAHAKNYSLLLAASSVRLAPLYDLISILPYSPRVPYREAKLAMRVDGEYAVGRIERRDWEGMARRCGLDAEPVVERVSQVADETPAAIERAAAAVKEEGLDHPIIDRMVAEVRSHSRRCLHALRSG